MKTKHLMIILLALSLVANILLTVLFVISDNRSSDSTPTPTQPPEDTNQLPALEEFAGIWQARIDVGEFGYAYYFLLELNADGTGWTFWRDYHAASDAWFINADREDRLRSRWMIIDGYIILRFDGQLHARMFRIIGTALQMEDGNTFRNMARVDFDFNTALWRDEIDFGNEPEREGVGYFRVTTAALRFRAAPSTESDSFAQVPENTEVWVLEQGIYNEGRYWHRVYHLNRTGYMAAEWLAPVGW